MKCMHNFVCCYNAPGEDIYSYRAFVQSFAQELLLLGRVPKQLSQQISLPMEEYSRLEQAATSTSDHVKAHDLTLPYDNLVGG